jgi:hypothetical protein
MATSLNGWSVIPSSSSPLLRVIAIPGTTKKVRVRAEIAPVFAAALSLVHQHVINLNPGTTAGYCYRQARMSNGFSNHASGTAVDMRYDVWTAAHKQFATPDQIRAMHAIMDQFRTTAGKRIFGWGGDWSSAFLDDMHLEIGQDWQPGVGSFVSAVDVQNVQKRLHIDANGHFTKTAPTVPTGPHTPAHALTKIPPFPGAFKVGAHGPYVKSLQTGLVRHGFKLVCDGKFGAQTKAAVVAIQKKNRKLQPADGIVGPVFYKTFAVAI